MTHINQRHDYSNNWTVDNPTLQAGEVGWEVDTRKSKLGDGVTAWNDLAYTVSAINATAADIGLGSVDNTSDMDKPVSVAQQNTLDTKADAAATTAALATKAPLDSPALTGNPTAPTPAAADNDTSIATTAFVKAQAYATVDSPIFTGNPTAPTPAAGDNDTSLATTAFVKAAIDATAVDSGWITVGSGGSAPAYAAGYADANSAAGYKTRFRKVGNIVTVTVQTTKSAVGGTIFTLPAGYRPSVTIWQPLAGSVAPAANQQFAVAADGTVNVGTSSLANGSYYGTITFCIG